MREWSVQYGTPETDDAYGLAVHPDGAIYVGGTTTGAFPGFTRRGDSDNILIRIPE